MELIQKRQGHNTDLEGDLMDYEWKQIIFNVKGLAKEIRTACDDCQAKIISEVKLKEIIVYYATNYPTFFFNGQDINQTVKNVVGKKRTIILKNICAGEMRR